MGHTITTISILLLLTVTTYCYPNPANSEETQNGTAIPPDVERLISNANAGDLLQGDIKINTNSIARNGVIDTRYRWPDGVIPYYIYPTFNYHQRKTIMDAINDFERTNNCIKFRPYETTDRDYVVIKSDASGCWANVGRIGGGQSVNLELPACVYMKGTVVHELMHTIGFYHEQNRSDRDQYVTIHWQNVQDRFKSSFSKFNPTEITAFGAYYDYNSVVHYPSTAFSKNNQPTIVSKSNRPVPQRQINSLSDLDIWKIKRMYNCAF